DLRNIWHRGVHHREHSGRILRGVAWIEACLAAADSGDECAYADLLLSEHGHADQYRADHDSDVAGDVRLRFWICRRDAGDDAGDRSREIPDRALRVRQLTYGARPDRSRHGQWLDPVEDRL